jgi:chromosome segregation ATPase
MPPPDRDTPKDNLSQEEVAHRVAVLKRFRELLSEQRNRFREYLEVLDKQKDVIEKGDAEALVQHVELEEKIVADIFAVQRVIDPLEDMYRTAFPEKDAEIPHIKATLEDLKSEALSRSQRNRKLLSQKMEELRTEIRTLRNNPFGLRRPAYNDADSASLIDIKG